MLLAAELVAEHVVPLGRVAVPEAGAPVRPAVRRYVLEQCVAAAGKHFRSSVSLPWLLGTGTVAVLPGRRVPWCQEAASVELKLRVVADHQPQLRVAAVGSAQPGRPADQRLPYPAQGRDAGPGEQDGVLDPGVVEDAVAAHRRIRANDAVGHHSPGPHHGLGGTWDRTILVPWLDANRTDQLAVRVDLADDVRRRVVQQDPVALQHVLKPPGVLPESGEHLARAPCDRC